MLARVDTRVARRRGRSPAPNCGRGPASPHGGQQAST